MTHIRGSLKITEIAEHCFNTVGQETVIPFYINEHKFKNLFVNLTKWPVLTAVYIKYPCHKFFFPTLILNCALDFSLVTCGFCLF